MRLSESDARARLAAHDHGTLCTVHPRRGVDAVPCLYAVVDGHIGFPIDRVKPKLAGALQREHNLERDARAALLIEHWDRENWSQLWWVRAELRFDPAPSPETTEALAADLASRFTQYRDRPFERVMALRILGITGWAAAG